MFFVVNLKKRKLGLTLKLIYFVFVFCFIIAPMDGIWAASFVISPSGGSYRVGQTIIVTIFANSSDAAMNAVQGVLNYPQDKLRVDSLQTQDTIIDFWVENPAYSNFLGTVNFEGIVLNPGYTGDSGKILSITFMTLAAGTANLNFTQSSILANDGKGSNILKNVGGAQLQISVDQPDEQNPVEYKSTENVDQKPQIIKLTERKINNPSNDKLILPIIVSQTHPDSNRWYSNKVAVFSWEVPTDRVERIRLLVDKNSDSKPTIVQDTVTSTKKVEDLEDGVWYLHAQFRNGGTWGPVAHFRFQIDSRKPSDIKIEEVAPKRDTDPTRIFNFVAKDDLSGIAYFEVRIDGKKVDYLTGNENYIYESPVLDPGDHSLIVKAVDKAGNYLLNSTEFKIDALITPEISEFSKVVDVNQIVSLKGKTYPSALVQILLKKEKKEINKFNTIANEQGDFEFLNTEKLEPGFYSLQLQVIDENGAKSNLSQEIKFVIKKPLILEISSYIVSIFTTTILFVALLMLLAAILLFGYIKLLKLKRQISKRDNVIQVLKTDIKMDKNVKKIAKLLEKTTNNRQLTQEEKKVLSLLKKKVISDK